MAICHLSLLSDSRSLCWSHWLQSLLTYVLCFLLQCISSACKRRWLECCHLSIPSPPVACAGPACVQHALHIVVRPDSHFVHMCVLFCDILCPEVQSHSDDGHMDLAAPCSVCALGQARPKILSIHLVILLCVCMHSHFWACALVSLTVPFTFLFPLCEHLPLCYGCMSDWLKEVVDRREKL